MLDRTLRFVTLYKLAVDANVHRWASGIVDEAFKRVMGREPSSGERQIVMAVSDLETSYGRGWGHGKSTGGQGSHNWGAIQTKKTGPSFSHGDSSSQGTYQTNFKIYPDDVSGAAGVVSTLFKSSKRQRMPDPENGERAMGPEIPGPSRGELIQAAVQSGDTLAFSKAMWYTVYFEGTAPKFTQRIRQHSQSIQKIVNSIASALGESPAWGISNDNCLPVTNDQSVIDKILQIDSSAGGSGSYQNLNTSTQNSEQLSDSENQDIDFDGISNIVWFE